MYKLSFFVPRDFCEEVKAAVFEAGAGRMGNYDSCSWQVAGTGQFRPLEGSDPFIGSKGSLEKIEEYRVEMVCSDELIADAVDALRKAHPYEEPAYDIWKLADF